MASQREDKYKRYNFVNINIQEFPTAKGCQRQGPNSQRHPTLSQKPPFSIISPLPRHRNLQKGLHSGICLTLSRCTYHHRTAVVCPKRHTVNPHASNLHTSIMSDNNLFCAFMYVFKNYSTLRISASKYKVHSRIIKKLLDEYEYHQIYRTSQEK